VTNFYGGMFYLYLFLVSTPIFITIKSNSISFTNRMIGAHLGANVNMGILLLPVLVALLGLKLFNKPELKVGNFGKLIIIYSCICFSVMLYGLLEEAMMVRFLLFGQVITPFVAYFFLLNFAKHIKFIVVKVILISSLILQFCFLLLFTHKVPGNSDIFTSAGYFIMNSNTYYLYGAYDYYPILFLTLVIFFHEMVNKPRSVLWRNALIIFTIILYGYGLVFHSRNSVIALLILFMFYLFKRGNERKIVNLFIWIMVFALLVGIFCPDIVLRNASVNRIRATTNKIINRDAFGKHSSAAIRLQSHKYALKVVSERPLTGIAYKWPLASHNQYLSILGVSGVVAFSFFMLLLWRIHQKLRRNLYFLRKRHQGTALNNAMYSVFVIFVVSSLFQNNFTVTYTSCIFWALMGICEIKARKDQNDLMSTAKQGVNTL
jgi:hypothetical protein